MIDVMLFLEDLGHESLIKALVERVAREKRVAIKIKSRSVRGGHGRALAELRQFLRDLRRGHQVGIPQLLVVAIDANCKGLGTRKKGNTGMCSRKIEAIASVRGSRSAY